MVFEEYKNNYDDKFDDLDSIIKKLKFEKLINSNEGEIFRVDNNEYRKFKSNFDKRFEKLVSASSINKKNKLYNMTGYSGSTKDDSSRKVRKNSYFLRNRRKD